MSDDQLSLVPGKKKRVKAEVPIAKIAPVAHIAIDSPLPHLDRVFDYAVPEKFSDLAQPGVRVRVRFAGKLTDGWLISRSDESDHPGTLAALTNVISPEVALIPEVLELAKSVVARQAGTLSDVLRSAIPNRHATAEATEFPPSPKVNDVEPTAWSDYTGGAALIKRTIAGDAPRAVVTTGCDDAAVLIAQYSVTVSANDGKVIIVVDDDLFFAGEGADVVGLDLMLFGDGNDLGDRVLGDEDGVTGAHVEGGVGVFVGHFGLVHDEF